MLRRLVATTLAVAFAATSCTTSPGTDTSRDDATQSPAAEATTVTSTTVVSQPADPDQPTVVVLDSVTIEFPDGALTDGARVEVNEIANTSTDDMVPGVQVAGTGIDVSIIDGELIGDANVTFDVDTPSDPDAIPVVLHVADDGTVTVDDATYTNGQIQISTNDFSLRLPGWLNPINWIKGLFAVASPASSDSAPTHRTAAPPPTGLSCWAPTPPLSTNACRPTPTASQKS